MVGHGVALWSPTVESTSMTQFLIGPELVKHATS